jgi:hypothetical protein
MPDPMLRWVIAKDRRREVDHLNRIPDDLAQFGFR